MTKLWTRRSKPHWSEIEQKYYPDLLSTEEWIRKGELVSIIAEKIYDYYK